MDNYFGGSSGDLLADKRYALALQLAEWGDFTAAADLLRQGIELAPAWPPFYFHLGDALRRAGKMEEARAALNEYLALDPADHMGATIKLALVGANAAPPSLPPDYIQSLFDQYAPKFDKCLVENLNYQTPKQIAEAVRAVRGAPYGRLLDLGCGTGLAAAEFLKDTTYREGVDLSPRMVDEAKKKNIYDALHAQSIEEYLDLAPPQSFDLVLCADVLIYLGVLDHIIAGAGRALASGGLFAFSVQSADAGDWVLGEDHRYAHSSAYIERCAAAANLALIKTDPVVLRMDGGNPVHGTVFVCTHSS